MNTALKEYFAVQKRLLKSVWRILSKILLGGVILGYSIYLIILLYLVICWLTNTLPFTITPYDLFQLAVLAFLLGVVITYLIIMIVVLIALFNKK